MSRRRKRGRNPKNNHSGLGALVGSVLGGMPGALVAAAGARTLGGVMVELGWIAGGAAGGYFGASDDRKVRGAIGGGIGGIFTPLGAWLGGYIGGLEPDGKARNPVGSTVAIALGAGILAAGAGYGAYRLMQRRREGIMPGEGVSSILDASTMLGDVPSVVADIQQPIMMQSSDAPLVNYDMVPVLRVMLGERVVEPESVRFGFITSQGLVDSALAMTLDGEEQSAAVEPKAIAALLPGLTPTHTQAVYELALVQIGNGVDWDVDAERDLAIGRILTELVPSTDWSKGLSPYAYGGPEWQAWTAVQTLGTVANQSYFNKRALGGAA